jgi:phosphoribosylaminoimidazole-succinocarboxamide synthase
MWGLIVELLHSGKVRELYADGDDVIMVASDRISVYDVVLPTAIPGKGKILTQLSLWWFEQLRDVTANHVISATDVPSEWKGRAIRCRRLNMVKVECIARGYLAGLGLSSYQESGTVSGLPLPPGLAEGSRLPEPIFTPTTKAAVGHDEFMTFNDMAGQLGAGTAAELRQKTLEIYRRGHEVALSKGVIIADTKLEFGYAADGSVVLGDELLTPDSSRFWASGTWEPGRQQRYLDKQFVREWSAALDWDRTPPGPPIPEDIALATRALYVEVYERITGARWQED